jgi:hypothetical protein
MTADQKSMKIEEPRAHLAILRDSKNLGEGLA